VKEKVKGREVSSPKIGNAVLSLSQEHREYYAIGAVGHPTTYDFRISFYNKSGYTEDKRGKKENIYEINTTVILPYQPLKELGIWMMMHYLDYEEEHGELPLEDVPLENLIKVLEKLKEYDIEDLKMKLAEIKKTNKKETQKKKHSRRKKKR